MAKGFGKGLMPITVIHFTLDERRIDIYINVDTIAVIEPYLEAYTGKASDKYSRLKLVTGSEYVIDEVPAAFARRANYYLDPEDEV